MAGEVGDQLGELRLVTNRVTADNRVADACPVGDRRRTVRAEQVALARLHGERCQRVAAGGVDQCPHPRQVAGLSSRGCGPHQCQAGPRDQHVAEQIEGQHVRGDPGE
jgi:hypothetical protein